jgi:hypothetical protein
MRLRESLLLREVIEFYAVAKPNGVRFNVFTACLFLDAFALALCNKAFFKSESAFKSLT